MASQELLQILGSGATFGAKRARQRDRKQEGCTSSKAVNFFSPPASAGSRGKRRRESHDCTTSTKLLGSEDSGGNFTSCREARLSSSSSSEPTPTLQLFGRDGAHGANVVKNERVVSKTNVGCAADLVHTEEVASFRRRMGIRVKGSDVADPIETFSAMPHAGAGEDALHTRRVLLKNIEASDWKEPTPIQMQAVPVLLAGRDLLAAAPTGSGKTAAFVMPMILRMGMGGRGNRERGVRALLLAPTRELATQIHREVLRLCRGKKLRIFLLTQAGASKTAAGTGADRKCALSNYDIVVTTPMRLLALLRIEAVSLSKVAMVVLDEADKLFDAGPTGGEGDRAFVAQVDEILAACSCPHVQKALFSATMGKLVMELAQSVLRDHVVVNVGNPNAGAANIDQRLVYVGKEEGKLLAMRQIVRDGLRPPVLVFLQSKDRAKELFHELVYDGINVEVMHADRTQDQRDRIIQRFRTGEIWVLISTDLMARGIDFKGVNMVINYDFPQNAVSYIHRIGRTGRAGRHGVAVTLFTEGDMDSLRSVSNVMRLSGCEVRLLRAAGLWKYVNRVGMPILSQADLLWLCALRVPDWMLSMQRHKSERVRRRRGAPKRETISTVSKYDALKSRRRNRKGRIGKNISGTMAEAS